MGKIICPRFSIDWGSMMLIESQGEYLLIDTYSYGDKRVRQVVSDIVRNERISLIHTHGHRDHNGDTDWYLDKAKRYYCSVYDPYQESNKDKDRHLSILSKCSSKGIPVTKLRTGSSFVVGGAKVTCMFAGNQNSNNAKSLCLLIEMDGCKILNLGDATEWTLKQLVLQGYDLSDIDIWMFNHHGVPENNPQWWISKIAPTFAISNCCGESKNTYKSWAKDVYARCEKAEVNCFSTQHNGDLEFECVGGMVFPSAERNTTTATRNGRTSVFNASAKKYWRGNLSRKNRLPRDLAVEVMLQQWGHGDERVKKIRNAGYSPEEVQAFVNQFVNDDIEFCWALGDYVWRGFAGSGQQRKNVLALSGEYDYYDKAQMYVKWIDDLAQRVMRGEFGIGPDRVSNLEKEGYRAYPIQNRVNQILGSSARS